MDVEEEVVDLAGALLGHSAVMVAVLGALQRKGLFTQADVNEVMNVALTGAETATGVDPRVIAKTRRMLEQTARTLGGPIRRR